MTNDLTSLIVCVNQCLVLRFSVMIVIDSVRKDKFLPSASSSPFAPSAAAVKKRFKTTLSLWPPYVIGQAIIFLLCGFFLLPSIYLSFFLA